jgi:hypothetical protein
VANQVNQVQQTFNGLGQLISEAQIHGNSQMLNSQGQYANHSRLTSLTYPNGRQVNYQYASGLNDATSRLTSLRDNGAPQPLEGYSYLGLGTAVRRAHPEPGIDLTYIQQPNGSTDGGDPFTGLDRFGRVLDQLWAPSAGGTPTDRFQYGYDRDSNRLYRNNLVNALFGEVYHASGAGFGYDNFNQLTAFSRGTLSASQSGGPLDTIAGPSHSQS